MSGPRDWTRRRFLAGGLAGALTAARAHQDSLPTAGPSGKLVDPGRAGRPIEPVTAREEDAAIRSIERRLRCTCGCTLDVYTCRTTDFTCTTSPAMHRRVLALFDAGVSADGIIAAFVEQYGAAVLMAPPRRGFNLVGYFLPGGVVLSAAVLLLLAMRRWVRASARGQPVESAGATPATAAELERLRRELARIDA